jgi:hypothetical protein
MCNPHFGVNRCAAPAVCGATSFASGRCVAPTMEPAGAHATPMTAGAPVTTPAVIAGALTTATEVDCYALTVPANGSIYAEVNDGMGGCPANADSVLILYDSMFRAIDGNDDSLLSLCSQLDGTQAGSASHGLAAGTYYLCVQPYPRSMPIPQYYLDINVTP